MTLRTFKAVNLLSKVFFFLKGSRATLMRSTSVGSESCGCKHVDKQGREVRDLYLCTTRRRGGKKRSLHAHVISYQIKRSDLIDFLPSLQSPPAPPPEPQRSQLLVGSAHYLQTSHKIDLTLARNDAVKIRHGVAR